MTALPRPLTLPELLWNLLIPARELANSHPDGICDLPVGTPVDPTPQFTRDALVETSDAHGYLSVIGTQQLRRVILAWGTRRRMMDVGVEGVTPTTGSKEAVTWFPTLLGVHPGGTVLIPEVAYPIYDIGIRPTGATPVPVDPTWSGTWPDTALILLNSPGNPDSHVLSISQPRATPAWARRHETVIISNEYYAMFPWTAPWIHEGVLSILDGAACRGGPSGVIVLCSLSKQSNLTGYRAAVVYGDPMFIV